MSAKLLASASLLPGMSRVVADSGRARDPAQISLETIEGTKRLNVSKNAILHSAFYHVEDEDKEEESSLPPSSASPPPDDNSDTQNKLRKISTLDVKTLNSVTKDITSSVSILASYFDADLISSIISGLQLSARISSSANNDVALSALCKLTLAVVHQLFQSPHAEKPPPPPTVVPTEGSPSPPTEESPPRFPSNNHPLPSSSISIQDLITQDLSSTSSSGELPDISRREILLSLMASARMDDGSLGASSNILSSRLLSTLERRSNDPNPSNTPERALTSRVLEGLQRNTSGLTSSWRELRHCLRSASSKRVSGATLMLIQNGLLLDSVPWVKRSLSAGADAKSVDEDGHSIVSIAVALGCSNDIIKVRMDEERRTDGAKRRQNTA